MSGFDFTDKTVVVTGGGSGIGFSIAKSFLVSGANVIICGRKEKRLIDAKNNLISFDKSVSDKVKTIPCDMSIESSVSEMFYKCANFFSQLDIFVNNSGAWLLTPILDVKEDEILYIFNNNLKSTILGSKFAAQSMKRGGSIINIGSFAGMMAQKNASLYSCCKNSILSFTKSAASELADLNIRVNCVIPGVIRTPMTSKYIDDNYEQIIQSIPLKRTGNVEEVANGVLFLASDLANYITGACLEITGGKYSTQL